MKLASSTVYTVVIWQVGLVAEVGPARHSFHPKWTIQCLVDAGYISAGEESRFAQNFCQILKFFAKTDVVNLYFFPI